MYAWKTLTSVPGFVMSIYGVGEDETVDMDDVDDVAVVCDVVMVVWGVSDAQEWPEIPQCLSGSGKS